MPYFSEKDRDRTYAMTLDVKYLARLAETLLSAGTRTFAVAVIVKQAQMDDMMYQLTSDWQSVLTDAICGDGVPEAVTDDGFALPADNVVQRAEGLYRRTWIYQVRRGIMVLPADACHDMILALAREDVDEAHRIVQQCAEEVQALLLS